MTFEGFTEPGLDLLKRLPAMSKADFAAGKSVYKNELFGPTKAFVDALGPVLRNRVSSGLVFEAKTRGSIAPINNDLRFNPDATPYKDHVLLRFWEGASKKTAPTVYVRLTGAEVGFAAGAQFEDVKAWRTAVEEDGEALAAALSQLVRDTGADVVGQELKRVPSPYDDAHAHRDLLRHKWLQARWSCPLPLSVGQPAFVDFCADELAKAGDVHGWLVGVLG